MEKLRADFPILTRQAPPGGSLVYLDSAATSLKPRPVIDAVVEYYEAYSANVHRGLHRLSEKATAAYEDARSRVAQFIGAHDAREVIFTRGTTESINLVAHAWGHAFVHPGDEVLLSEMEHHANLVPWQMLAKERGVRLKFLPITDDGLLDVAAWDRLDLGRLRLVALTAMSNVLGTRNTLRAIAERAHAAGALLLVDAAQCVAHEPTRVAELAADFVAFSGHKMCGPTGIGVLWGRRDLLERMPPLLGGGEMIRRVTLTDATYNDVPWKFEPGTPPIAEAIGLGAAVDYLSRVGLDTIRKHEDALTRRAYAALRDIPGVRIVGPGPECRGPIVSFTLDGIHPHDVAQWLDAQRIAIRAGHHCAMPLHERLRLAATARASFAFYNTAEEIDKLAASLTRLREFFQL